MKKVTDFVIKYKKELVYAVGGLLVLYAFLWVSTRQPKIPANIKATIDSLTDVNRQLVEKQKRIDSTIKLYETEISQIDSKVANIKEKTTIVREYYHEVGQQAGKYTPTQIDSFFKVRYNY